MRVMTVAEREAFLAEPHIAVVSVASDNDRGPVSVPLWYAYTPGGDITLITPLDSRKAALVRRHGRVTLCVQRTEPPRTYVSVEGPVVEFRTPATLDERRALAHRYLGVEAGDAFVEGTADRTAGSVLIRVRPEHWLSRGAS